MCRNGEVGRPLTFFLVYFFFVIRREFGDHAVSIGKSAEPFSGGVCLDTPER